MSRLTNKRVLITGGGSGIGKIMGRMALEKGAELIIWDINQLSIDGVVKEFNKLGKVTAYIVDISDIEQIKSTAEKVRNELGTVDILINNAGIVVGKYFDEHSTAEIQRTMDINASAPMYVTAEFLGQMIVQRSGHICNIASSAGFIANPRMSVYAASKWAVIGWSDSLRLEMQFRKTRVKVSTVTPYYINTGMFAGVKSLIPILKPEKVAAQIISGIERNRIIISMPFSMHFIRLCQGLLSIRLFDWVAGNILQIYKTMDHFKGRK
ncbi:MAG: SDR family oxidoreductase [Paludibacter sp.]